MAGGGEDRTVLGGPASGRGGAPVRDRPASGRNGCELARLYLEDKD